MDRKLLGKKINLARKSNINANYLRQIESGAKTPSLPVFILLCKELKVSASYLLSDILNDPEITEMDELQRLWQTATPKQIKLISSMIRSALENIDE